MPKANCSTTSTDFEKASPEHPIQAKAGQQIQFERHGYFVADRIDHTAAKPVFNLAVGLKDSWGK